MSFKKSFLVRHLRARPRLFISGFVGLLVSQVMPYWMALHEVTRMIISWNVGAILYLILGGIMMARSTHQDIRLRASQEDEGDVVILILVIITALVSLASIVAELAASKDIHGLLKYWHIGLAGLTILTSWAFTHMMFALHYAHEYYKIKPKKISEVGLAFPGDDKPDYSDFLYFAFVIGTSGQTADVSFTTTAMRRVGLVHCILSFMFNTTLLALTINIAASLI